MSRISEQKPKFTWSLLVVAALVLAAGVGIAISGKYRAWFGQPETSSFRQAPRFELKDFKGQARRLEELRGNTVLVHFWASWCPPCLNEIPDWLEMANRMKGRPVRFVAISLDQKWEDAQKILPDDRLPMNVVSVLDESQKVPDQFGTYQYPETYLLSPDLRIVSKWVGPQDWKSPAIQKAIEQASSESGR